jgi:hypothetical protein
LFVYELYYEAITAREEEFIAEKPTILFYLFLIE